MKHIFLVIFAFAICVCNAQLSSTVLHVNKYRTWIRDIERKFRPDNKTAPPLPNHGVRINPPKLSKHSLVQLSNGKFLAFGGETESEIVPNIPFAVGHNDLYLYDPARNTWYNESTHTENEPYARVDHVAFAVGNVMYVHGGVNTSVMADVWKYENRTWKEMHWKHSPALRGHTANVIFTEEHGHAAILFGGINSVGEYTNELYSVTVNGTVFKLQPFGTPPRRRAFHATAVMPLHDREVLLVQGGTDGSQEFTDLYQYDFKTNTWSLLNAGYTPSVYGFDNTLIPSVRVKGARRHACIAKFPTLFCIGGRASSTPISMEYDYALGRWIRNFFTNPTDMMPLINHRLGLYVNKHSVTEILVFGGVSGAPAKFTAPITMWKTNMHMDPCPVTYINPDWDGKCFICPRGSGANVTRNPHKCTPCLKGTYSTQGQCLKCPIATYNPHNASTNVSACVSCPPGHFTVQEGAHTVSQCITCELGAYSSGGQCQKCPPGTYGVAKGEVHMDLSCAPCEYGTFSDAGATSCDMCLPGMSSGPFIKRLEPYRLVLFGMGQQATSSPPPCTSIASPITTVNADQWIFIMVRVADWGSDTAHTGAYNSMRLDIWDPLLTLTVEYEGNDGLMFYDCPNSVDAIPSCPSTTVNVSSAPLSRGGSLCDIRTTFMLRLRFNRPSPATTIRIKGQGVIGLEYTFAVVSMSGTVEFMMGTNQVVPGLPTSSLWMQALLKGTTTFDPTASWSTLVIVMCIEGFHTYSFDGGSDSPMQTVAFTNGVRRPQINFVGPGPGTNCVFRASTVPPSISSTTFNIIPQSYLTIEMQSMNVSNFGRLRIDVTLRSTDGTNSPDNSSTVQLRIANVGPFVKQVFLKPHNPVLRVISGIAIFDVLVFTTNHTAHPWVVLEAHHISGPPTLLTKNETKRIWVRTVNGTVLRQVEKNFPMPPSMAANRTLVIEVENVNVYGQHDSSRDKWIEAVIHHCSARITIVNSTRLGPAPNTVQLVGGHAIVHLLVTGHETHGCAVEIREFGVRDLSKGFFTTPFDVFSAHKLAHNHCANPDGCASCPDLELGSVTRIAVQVLSQSGQVVTHDSYTVIRMDILGNVSAGAPVDGVWERQVVNGETFFDVQINRSMVPVQVVFSGGFWKREPGYNYTYAIVPTFKRFSDYLGLIRTYVPQAYIATTSTCPQIPKAITSVIKVTSRIPIWLQHGKWLQIELSAENEFEQVDSAYGEPATWEVKNCEQGYARDLTWVYIDDTNTEITYVDLSQAPFPKFSGGRAVLSIAPRYVVDTAYDAGIEKCTIGIRSGNASTFIGGFTIRHVFAACGLCPPGQFSGGGNGTYPVLVTHHPGGCVPCMAGTFSADSGSTTEASCQVCPKGFGFSSSANVVPQEGVTSCDVFCAQSTLGQTGGGQCLSGSITSFTDDRGRAGRTMRRCYAAQCLANQVCGPGTFIVNCLSFSSESACLDYNKGTCAWNATSGTCSGPGYACVDCPAGRVQPGSSSNGVSDCRRCDPGGWSSAEGHTDLDGVWTMRSPYRCGAHYRTFCRGSTTGQCWNGTYSSTSGATSNATCLECPAGHYCHQIPLYRYNTCPPNPCPDAIPNPYCNQNNCFRCPQTVIRNIIGAPFPIACPVGTYNNYTGRSSLSACLQCPAGTYCPEGSTHPQLADTDLTQFEDSGIATPVAVSFYRNSEVIPCASEVSDNAPGYVLDGRFSEYNNYFQTNWGGITSSYSSVWSGSFTYITTDRGGSGSSGSIQMNATRGVISQTVEISHELPLEMVGRVWVYNQLQYQNLSKIMRNPDIAPKPFAGLEVTVHYTDYFDDNATTFDVFSKSIEIGSHMGQWQLLEVVIRPTEPVRYATFNLSTRGWYQGYARFDDVSLKPSHRRICNCSTGYYYNETEPSSRKCRLCPPGFACSGGTIIRCVDSWSVSRYAGCLACRDGWLCDSDGRGRLIPCEPYTKRDSLTQTCSPCELGYACRDGVQRMCDDGMYGDGGLDCIACHPGYYAPKGSPQIQCKRCAPGHFSVAGRSSCIRCPPNHYSPNGTMCFECPKNTFAPEIGTTECRQCTSNFLDHTNVTVGRNAVGKAIRVVPAICQPFLKFKVERVEHMVGQSLGTVTISDATPSVLYHAGPIVGVHRFKVFFTRGFRKPEQHSLVEITIDNSAPVANDDEIGISHPAAPVQMTLGSFLFNDWDPNKDDLFFATAQLSLVLPSYGISNVVISSDRKTVSWDLPASFTGPGYLTYTVMDKNHSDVNDCIAPICQKSALAQVRLLSKQTPPVASSDYYETITGRVLSLDVLANDVDIDGDEIVIKSATITTSGRYPSIRTTCTPPCGGACQGVASCTCGYDPLRQKCFPSVGREYFLDYTSLTAYCGIDRFNYTIESNDGESTTEVVVKNTRCYCDTHNPGIDMIFLLDGTRSISDFSFQLSFVDGVQRRSSESSNFQYGIIEVGANNFVHNLSSTYIDRKVYSRHETGDRLPYTLGEGISMAKTMKDTSGIPTQNTYVIIISGGESFDNIQSAAAAFPGARFITYSVSTSQLKLGHFAEVNSWLDVQLGDFVDLIGGEGQNVETTMDLMCGSN